MIVVDANIVAYLMITGRKTALARKLRELEPSWAVPSLCKHEFASLLGQYVMGGGMPAEDIPELWDRFGLIINGHEHEIEIPAAVLLSCERNINVYDANYVLLAQRLDVVLVTENKQLATSCPAETSTMRQYLKQAES